LRLGRIGVAVAAAVCTVAVSGANATPTATPCQPDIQREPTPHLSQTSLNGITVSPGGIIWAVGERGWSGSTNIVLRWNGHRYRRVPSPSPPNAAGDNALHDVVAPTDDTAWAAGIGIQRWDGEHWQQDTTPTAVVWGISATAPDNVWAAGVPLTKQWGGIYIARYDGTTWHRIPFLRIPLTHRDVEPGYTTVTAAKLDDVLALAPDDVWVAGTNAHDAPMSAHWDGKAWRYYPMPRINYVSGPVHLAAGPHGELWAAAGEAGLILQWNGHRWLQRGHFTAPNHWAISARRAIRDNEVWAIVTIGDVTNVLRWTGSSWTRLYTSEKVYLGALTVDRNGDVLAVGRGGRSPVVVRFRCSTSP
jgi:hypothetical protein